MSNSIGNIALDLGINQGHFNNQLQGIAGNAESMVGGAFKKLGVTIAAAFATAKLISFGDSCIELASNLSEVQNVVDVTFGNMAEDVNNFAKSAITSLGMSELSAKKFTSTMGAMLKSSGLAGQQMLTMSKGVTTLAGDMASFYNLSQEMAFDKIRAGLAGETEPLRQLGINMSVANLQAYALSKGIQGNISDMSQAQQTLIRYNYLMSVSKDAQGDFARTSGSWANQTRILSEQFKSFQAVMGQGFINILTPVLGMLNSLIAKLMVAAQYFKAFTELITGQKAATQAAISASTDMSGAAGGMGDAIKKAGKAAKGSISGFDELNVISQDTAGAMDDIAGLGGDIAGMDMAAGATTPDLSIDPSVLQPIQTVLDTIKTTASEIVGFLSNAFGPPLQQAINAVIPSLVSWKNALAGAFADIATLGEPLKKWFLNDLVPFWQKEIVLMGNILGGLLDSGAKVFTDLKNAIMPVLKAIVTDGLPMITEIASGCLDVFSSMFTSAKSIFDTLWSEGVSPGLSVISNNALIALEVIKGFWDTWGGKIVSGLVATFDSVKILFGQLWEVFLKPIWTNLLAAITTLWNDHFKGLLTELGSFVGKLVTGVLDIYNKFIVPLVSYLVDILAPTFTAVINSIVNIVSTLIGIFTDIVASIIKIFGGLIDFVVGIFTGDWKRSWEGIKSIFSGTWDLIKSVLKGALDIVVSVVKSSINIVSGIFTSLKNTAVAIFTAIKNHITTTINNVAEIIKTVINTTSKTWSTVWNAVKTTATTVWNGIKTTISTVINTISSTIKNVVSGIQTAWSIAWAAISTVVSVTWKSIKTGVETISEGVAKVFNGLKNTVLSIWDGIWGGIKGVINMVIAGINKMIDAFNGINIQIPVVDIPLVGTVGGGRIGFSIPRVPALANGGLVSSPTLAMVGDNKNANIDPEVVTPLSKLQDMLGGSNQGIIEALMMILDAIENQPTTIELDGEKISRNVHKNLNKIGGESNRVGKRAITVGGVFA